jgi:hypothetical protein
LRANIAMNQLRTKYLLTAILILGILSAGKTQSFTLSAGNTTFNVNSTNIAETGTTIGSSFTLNVTNSNRFSITAFVSSKSSSAAIFTSIPLQVSLNNIAGAKVTGAVTGAVSLAESPSSSVLASNSNTTGQSNSSVWTYNLILLPIEYNIPPGSYSFIVTVQYTEVQKTITQTFPISVTVQNITALTLTQNTLPNFTFATPSQFTSGISLDNASTFTIKCNKPWVFTASSNTSNFLNSGSYSTTMPASILNLKVGTIQVPLSTTLQQLNAGTSTPKTGTSFDMSYTANVGYTYGPGDYTITVTYTLTAQ